MATFAPETLMEGGILAVLGVTVEGAATESSLQVLFVSASFVSTAVAFFFWFFLPVALLSIIATSSKGFILTGVTDELLAVEEDDDGSGALRRGQ